MTSSKSQFPFNHNERTAVLIDGISTHAAAKNLEWTIDFKRLLDFLKAETYLVKAYYFSPFDVSQEENAIVKLLDWLDFNGYNTVLVEYEEERKAKGNIDVEFTLRAMRIADKVDHIVLFTGTGRYVPLVNRLDEMGKITTVCSTIKGGSRIASDELRRAADNFIDLDSIRTHVERSQNMAA